MILIFFNNAFETTKFWYIVILTAILRVLQRKNSGLLWFLLLFREVGLSLGLSLVKMLSNLPAEG